MPRYSRLRAEGCGNLDDGGTYQNQRALKPPAAALPDGNGGRNATGSEETRKDDPQHRRAISATELTLKKQLHSQKLQKQSREPERESMPELFLGAPLENLEDMETKTWQTQWADALKKVQSLRDPGSSVASGRWPGVATEPQRPKSFIAAQGAHSVSARMSNPAVPSLSQWAHYPGPSRKIDVPQRPETSQPGNFDRENRTAGTDAWKRFLLPGAMSNREGKNISGGNLSGVPQGRGARSVTTFDRLASPLEAASQPDSGNQTTTAAPQGRPFGQQALPKAQFAHLTRPSHGDGGNTAPRGGWDAPQSASSLSAQSMQVQRTQSYRYGHLWGQKPEENLFQNPSSQGRSGASDNVVVPRSIMQKAISMREGGAHADAVIQMARAYSETVGVQPTTLKCVACGRGLGVIVQGDPGVDISFCQACRPSPLQWQHPTTEPATAAKKKKKGIVHFCRKILRLDKKQSQAKA